MSLNKFGSCGYDYVLNYIILIMRRKSLNEEHINKLTKENSGEFVSVAQKYI